MSLCSRCLSRHPTVSYSTISITKLSTNTTRVSSCRAVSWIYYLYNSLRGVGLHLQQAAMATWVTVLIGTWLSSRRHRALGLGVLIARFLGLEPK
jgi:hypothetical protein